MKIAIFSDCYLDLTGGIVTVINAEKAELERRGHTVYVFSSAYPTTVTEQETLAKNHIYPVPSCKFFGRGATPIARRPAIIEKWLHAKFPELESFDIFYIHYEAGCSIAGIRLAHKYGIPAVQVMHGREDVGEENLIPYGLRTIVATALNWFHSWYLPHPIKVHRDDYLATTTSRAKMWSLMVNHANSADLVITPSEHFRQKLIHYGVTAPSIALHHKVNRELIDSPATVRTLAPGEPLRLIWHSRVSGEKRPLVLLEALKIVQSQHSRDAYHLSVYGAGPDLSACAHYVREHQLNVTFHGNTPFSDIWADICKSHLDVLISYNYDTFGMTIIEAEAAGTPVLIADPDLAEIAPAGGYILSASPSAPDIATAIGNLLRAPLAVEQMSEVMLSRRHELGIEVKAAQLEKLFTAAKSTLAASRT